MGPIGEPGKLTGYAGGVHRKRALLTVEGWFNDTLSLFG
ncbi:MAG: hypothetical protein ACJARS_001354 [bacterium]